jgi:hypothetical protein
VEREEEESEDKEDKNNTKRYNLRKRKGKTVYVSASKIFRLNNLRDTDAVIEAMKRGYEVSIGGSFFAGSGGGSKTGKQNGRANQQNDQDTDDNDKEPQPQPDMQDAQPQQQKQSSMLTNLARYNAPGIKDNKKVWGKRNQRDKHQMEAECETNRNRISKSDMQHRDKQERMMENTRAEILASRTTRINDIKHNDASIITDSITNHVTGNITITNKENQQVQQSRQKPTRNQRTHATDGTSTDSSGISFIQEYEAGPEILVAPVPQENTSDDNGNGKKQESGKVRLEETRKYTAWDNQLKSCVTERRKRRHGIWNRKST